MNKRGQIYIIAALILSVVIFLLLSQTNFVQRILMEDDFEQISQNFDIESAKFMNSLLTSTGVINVKIMFESFTSAFTDYVKVENPEFEFIYVFDYNEQKLAGGYVMSDVIIGGGETITTIESGEGVEGVVDPTGGIGQTFTTTGESDVKPVEDISTIQIGDYIYEINVASGAPHIIIISREETGGQIKVYLNEEFITGRKVGGLE